MHRLSRSRTIRPAVPHHSPVPVTGTAASVHSTTCRSPVRAGSPQSCAGARLGQGCAGNPPARSQLPVSWRHHRSRGALRHLLFSVLKTSATLVQCPCLAWGGGSASAAEVGGQALPRGDGVVTGLGPEAARAPAMLPSLQGGSRRLGRVRSGQSHCAVQAMGPGVGRVTWLPARRGHGQEPGGLQPPQHVYGSSGCPGLSPCLSSRPPEPSIGRAGWGGAAQAWGVGRIWGSCSPVPLWGWGAVTRCPSHRIQGAGVSPCLEPEVPCAHLPPDVTNATMGTGSE